MEPKKNPEHDLEKKRNLFLSIGFAITLAMVLGALEYRSYDANAYAFDDLMMDEIEEEIIPITEREIKPPPPPPPMEELVIVEDEEELEEELEIEDMDIDEDMEIEIVEEEEEIIEDQIFTIVEQMPQFGGGEADLLNYLGKNIKYPQMAKESGISGIVYVTFVVGKAGKVADVRVLRGIGGGCDKEAVRVVKSMPDWKAGKQRGKPVSVQYNLPVRFVLR
ncbi:MAG: energy transducer TonB [Flavobacteriales bacterium]|nr:energy transducer TonB [Flavobacteriales bacterium]